MKTSLRQRLLAISLLGVISCAVALVALARVTSLTNSQRLERAREAMRLELSTREREREAAPTSLPSPTSLLGARGGHIARAADLDEPRQGLDAPARQAVAAAVHRAESTGELAFTEDEIAGVTRMVAAIPSAHGGFAFIVYLLRVPSFLPFWRYIVASLTLATALLVATALGAVATVRRGADALRASLAALAADLHAPVARPAMRELGEVADGIAGLAQDLARAEVDKERLHEELAQKDRLAALGRVAAGIAHEVRNPLASIKLRVDLGRARQGIPDPLARDLESVSEEITRLDRLVADLLVVAGRRTGPRVATALGPLAMRRAGLLAPWAEARGVRLEVKGDTTAEVDVDAIARAIDNLARNAVEASPPDSVVIIEIESAGEGARVRVKDRGAGVDPDRLTELFEPFFTTKPEGTGLGLALSRAIAAAHEGDLTYARRGAVTCFELDIPRAGRSSHGRAAARAAVTARAVPDQSPESASGPLARSPDEARA